MEGLTESLIIWLQTFEVQAPHGSVEELSDGVAMAEILTQIAPEYFDKVWISKIKTGAGNNWRLKVSNLKKILKGIIDYYSEVLCQQITGFKMPEVSEVGENNNKSELGRLLQLILGCAVNCNHKQEYIETIMGLEESVQHVVMTAIQELMTKESPTNYAPESLSDINDQLKRVAEELHMANVAKEQISQRCHELDMQVNVLQEEKASLALENEKLLDRLNHIESLEDPSTATGKRFQQLQQKMEILQDELYKVETVKDEYKQKSEIHGKEILELQQKNEELQKLADEAQLLKDELDVLRHTSSKVEQYETTIESYKKKLEDLSDYKRQIKMLEEKTTQYMHQNMELEEEVKKATMVKSQIDIYKKQLQELHVRLSEETRKADKAEFENKRLTEKFSSLQQEKERLIVERDSLRESIDELKCMQLQIDKGDIKGCSSTSISDSDILEAVSPDIKEKLIRLQHENKMLKLKEENCGHEQLALLQSMLDDSRAHANELETENRLANHKILELEGHIKDMQENQSSVSYQEVELRQKLNSLSNRMKETENDLKKKHVMIEALESQLEASVQKGHVMHEQLNKKDDEMKAMEERYRKYLEKAKNVIRTLDPNKNNGSGQDIMSLKKQLLEKNKIIADLEREAEKSRAQQEMEEKLLTSAFYSLGAQLQRKGAEERLTQSTAGSTFLSRQRQATTKRFNVSGVMSSDYFD